MTDPKKHTTSWAPAPLREAYLARTPSSEQEQESLSRVRRQLMQDFSETAPAKTSTSRSRYLWHTLATAGVFCMTWFFWLHGDPINPLEYQGITPHSVASKHAMQFKTENQKGAKITSQGHWSLELQKNTQISLQRESARQTQLQLVRGRIRVFVRPQQREHFVVTHQRWQVRVKGTRFAVSQQQDDLRIEVWSGLVEVAGPQETFLLSAGRGAAIDLKRSKVRHFPVPPLAARTLRQQIQWAKQLSPKERALFALDLSEQDHLSPKKRAQVLQKTLEELLPQLALPTMLALLEVLRPLEKDHLAFETNLYALTQRCYKVRKHQCLPLSNWYLQIFSQKAAMRPFLARIHYLHAAALTMPKDTQHQGMLLLKAYHESFPRGLDRRRACALIKAKLQLSPQASFRSLRKKIGPSTPWFAKYCPFSP